MAEDDGSKMFDMAKYEKDSNPRFYVKATDALGNFGQTITFYHVNSGKNIAFKAFLTAYTDTFRPEWTSEAVFGRSDPIYMYKNTVRNITVAFKVVAASQGEAFENLQSVQKLAQFLYPNYSPVGGANGTAPAQTISGAPLVRMGLMNVVRAGARNGGAGAPGKGGIVVESPPETGLLGVIQNVTVNHNLDNGNGEGGGFTQISQPYTTILPKVIEVNLDFAVIHENHLGWFDDGQFSDYSFPYNTAVGEDYRNSGPTAEKLAQDAADAAAEKAKWAAAGEKFQDALARSAAQAKIADFKDDLLAQMSVDTPQEEAVVVDESVVPNELSEAADAAIAADRAIVRAAEADVRLAASFKNTREEVVAFHSPSAYDIGDPSQDQGAMSDEGYFGGPAAPGAEVQYTVHGGYGHSAASVGSAYDIAARAGLGSSREVFDWEKN